MITATIALLFVARSFGQDAAASAGQNPSQLMSKVFAHYANAKSAQGTITMTQSAKGVSVHTTTELQFNRPSQLYIRQVQDGSGGHVWFVTSDGNLWSYDRPLGDLYGHNRRVENVTQHATSLTVANFLEAASSSLGDVNAMMVTAVSSTPFLRKLTGHWATLAYTGKVTLNGQIVNCVSGKYRDNPDSAVSGDFEAYVTDDGDFLRYVTHQRFAVPKSATETVDVTTTWDADLKLGVQTDPKLYKVMTTRTSP